MFSQAVEVRSLLPFYLINRSVSTEPRKQGKKKCFSKIFWFTKWNWPQSFIFKKSIDFLNSKSDPQPLQETLDLPTTKGSGEDIFCAIAKCRHANSRFKIFQHGNLTLSSLFSILFQILLHWNTSIFKTTYRIHNQETQMFMLEIIADFGPEHLMSF